MIRINLLSEGRRPVVARKSRARLDIAGQDPSVVILALGLLVGLVGGGVWWWMVKGDRDEVRAQVQRAQEEVDELRPIIQEVEDFKTKRASLTQKIEVIEDLKRRQTGPVYIMDQVSRALPDLLWLNDMAVRGNRVELRGEAFNTNAIAAFIGNLDQVPEFREPEPGDVAATRFNTYSFAIAFAFQLETPEDEEEEGEATAEAAS